jgi:hypothetical protein
MSMREWSRTPPMRAALAALAIAAALFLWTLVRALRADALPAAAPQAVVSLQGMTRGAYRRPADIQVAVENDLFNPDRTAPTTPYRMPGESAPDSKPRPEPPKPSVLGTAVASDGRNFATLKLGDASPVLVHVGDKIGEWIVRSIVRGKVVLESTSGVRAELAVPKPGT